MSLADKRQRTYRWDKKTLKFSSPTVEEGPIWKGLHECNAVFHYHARCPACGFLQRLEFTAEDGSPRVGWPEDVRDPGRIESEHLAWYECVQCKAHWDDYQRDKAVKLGEWREARTGTELFAYLDAHRPARVGFHLSALYSQFVSLSETAAAFLRKKNDKIKLRDFLNGYLAEPWKDYSVERREDHIFALCDERPRGLVPGGGVVNCMTAGVDTQDNGFWFEVRAWGWGMEMPSWQIREGFAHSFDGLEDILFGSRYVDSDDKEYPVNFVVIDAMGHRTREVYDWCRMWPGRVLPFKGEARMTQNLAVSNIDTYPGTRKPIPGGVRLLRGHVTFFKDALDGKLQIAPADPGAWLMHSECSEAWARQMCAEYRDERGLWQCPKGKANHAWDCSVYNLVAADFIQVKYRRRPEERTQEPAKQPSAQKGKPGWFNSGGHVPFKRRW